jgi:hypothetical protein
MKSLATALQKYALDDKGGYVTREFQDFGYRLAVELDDLAHKALYIRMAKNMDRRILEQARSFVLDANARNRARLFMWKIKEIRLSHQVDNKIRSKTTGIANRRGEFHDEKSASDSQKGLA